MPSCMSFALSGGRYGKRSFASPSTTASKSFQMCRARACLTRRVVDIWGDAADLPALATQAAHTVKGLETPIFPAHLAPSERTWKVDFVRYGRAGNSGLDEQGKRALLAQLRDVLLCVGGRVSLTHPSTSLVYYEDWHDFTSLHNAPEQAAQLLEAFRPRRRLLGRVVGAGCEGVEASFALTSRPFLGTTTLPPLLSHLTAVAALAGPGRAVLDPFCGTGSVLIACAAQGADVWGSDLDAAHFPAAAEGREKRRKAAFLRRNGQAQAGDNLLDNFSFYGLLERVRSAQAKDAAAWLCAADAADSDGDCGMQFSAIATDPPYGLREKV
eukprot:gene35241-42692_t